MKHRPQDAPRPLGSIRADELMPVRILCSRLGWERKTLAHAKRSGLKTTKFGRFDYCAGADVLEFFRGLAEGDGGPDA